jgi:hypothetical protein
MDPAGILRDLAEAQDLPRETLRLANAHRDELTGPFIAEVERYLASRGAARTRRTPLFFVFLLLGQWRATAAYRPLARLLRCPRHHLDVQFGDGLTETAPRVMAAVFDGDPGPLFDIVLDPRAEEFVRSGMLNTLAMVAVDGRLGRDDLEEFLRRALVDLRKERGNFVWCGLQEAVAHLGATELRPLVKHAFDTGLVDPRWLGYEDFEKDLEGALANPDHPWHDDARFHSLWGDTEAELSKWYGYSEDYDRDRQRRRERAISAKLSDGAAINPFRQVGRNDPCPCGSGRKYKRCCLGAPAPL